MTKYKVFIRSWYKKDPKTGKMVPHPHARKTHLAWANSADEARSICKQYNDSHNPGPTSRKAEFTSDY